MAKRVNFEEKHLSLSLMVLVLWAGIVGLAFQLNESITLLMCSAFSLFS